MNAKSIVSLILHAAILAGVLGCNDSASSGSTAVTLSGIVSEGVPGSETLGDPISGVEVCQFASNNCATSDETGFYALRLLKNREIELSYLNEGFGPVLVATTSGVGGFVEVLPLTVTISVSGAVNCASDRA